MTRRFIVVWVLMGLSIVGCGDDDPAAPVEAPLGLSSVAMPESGPDIAAALRRMPDNIGGLPASSEVDYELIRNYGESNTIVAFPFFDGSESLADDLAAFQFEPSAEVVGMQLDPDLGMLWVLGSFTDDGGAGLVHLVVWGDPETGWVFNVSAETAAMRDAITSAFVEAVSAGG